MLTANLLNMALPPLPFEFFGVFLAVQMALMNLLHVTVALGSSIAGAAIARLPPCCAGRVTRREIAGHAKLELIVSSLLLNTATFLVMGAASVSNQGGQFRRAYCAEAVDLLPLPRAATRASVVQ